jgi:GNAT superfamily N-acetyltransferase
MSCRAAHVRICPIQPGEVDLLRQRLGGANHLIYADQQSRGEGVYLIAWDADVPVGHLYIRWIGNTEVPRIVGRYPQAAQFADCPELCELYVIAERRSQGIGTQLLRWALELAREWGAAQVTICVDTDNPRARALYERLGFVEPGIGPFTTSGVLVDQAGRERPWQNGPQVMLVRKLGSG